MLIIRAAQMQAFQRQRDLDLVQQLVLTLERCDRDTARTTPPPILQQKLHSALLRARQFGIRDTGAVLAYFATARTLGERFDEAPSVRSVLTDPALPADLRIYRVAQLEPGLVQAELAGLAPRDAGDGH